MVIQLLGHPADAVHERERLREIGKAVVLLQMVPFDDAPACETGLEVLREELRIDAMAERLAAVDVDHGNVVRVARVQFGIAVDVDFGEVEGGARFLHRRFRFVAERAILPCVERDRSAIHRAATIPRPCRRMA